MKVAQEAEDEKLQVAQDGTLLLAASSDNGSVANSVAETITSATGQSWQSRNINDNFWLIPDTQDFGVWQ